MFPGRMKQVMGRRIGFSNPKNHVKNFENVGKATGGTDGQESETKEPPEATGIRNRTTSHEPGRNVPGRAHPVQKIQGG